MGLIVKVKITHYQYICTDEMEPDAAFENAETVALQNTEDLGIENAEIETMEITGCTEAENTDEDSIYEERKMDAIFLAS